LPGHEPLVINVVVVGPFEEEEEGNGVASDVVKVEGVDPATPGPLKKNDTGTVTIPQYRYNKTKQHTLQSKYLILVIHMFNINNEMSHIKY